MSKYFEIKNPYKSIKEEDFPEAGLLQLDISKANNLKIVENWKLCFSKM